MELYTEKDIIKDDGGELVRMSFTLPRQKGLPRFNAYFNGMKSALKQYASKDLKKRALTDRGTPAGAAVNTVVSVENFGLLSLYAEIVLSCGGILRRHRLGLTWNRKADTVLSYGSVFRCGKKQLLPLLAAATEDRAQSAGITLYSDWRKRLSRSFEKENFYISPVSAVFFYQGGILCEKNAPFPVSLPAESLSPWTKVLLWEN